MPENTVTEYLDLWQNLRKKNIIISSSRTGQTALYRQKDHKAECECLTAHGITDKELAPIAKALSSITFKSPCVIDISQAAELYKRQGISQKEAIMRSRIRYMGTDGVRGKISQNSNSPLRDFVIDGIFTPQLCELLTTGLMAYHNINKSIKVVIAEDGRDAFGEKLFSKFTAQGFRRFGCEVIDLGIAPTPLIPAAMAKLGAEYGAAITASHNPANQNGIKFFHKGRKLLPEPSDFAQSAFSFIFALEGMPGTPEDGSSELLNPEESMKSYFMAATANVDFSPLADSQFIVDCAHGAYAPFVESITETILSNVNIINADMNGKNINRDSGVAYIEGKEEIPAYSADEEICLVGDVYLAAQRTGKPVFGLALDGDGDRGLLLMADKENIYVIDGDRLAYLMTKGEILTSSSGKIFAGTVESDLMLFNAIEKLNLQTALTPVGDKWLSSTPDLSEQLFLGEESSGHMVWPVKIDSGNGSTTKIITGNGLLSGILGALAIRKLGFPPRVAATPYRPGIMKTTYAYYIDKSLFYANSPTWQSDVKCFENAFTTETKEGYLPEGCTYKIRNFPDEPDMLYFEILLNKSRLGAIFTRNSGTENKIATYARGDKTYEPPLSRIVKRINLNHVEKLKNPLIPEAAAGNAIVQQLHDNGSLVMSDVAKIVEKNGVQGEANVEAVAFSLMKEGRVRRSGNALFLA